MLQNRKYVLRILSIACLLIFFFSTTICGQPTLNGIRNASFNGLYTCYSTDGNKSGFYEFVAVNVGVSVFCPGWYDVSGSLCDTHGSDIINTTKQSYLNIGAQFILLGFNGVRTNGPYLLTNLTLSSPSGNVLDHVDNVHLTKVHSPPASFSVDKVSDAELNRNFADYGVRLKSECLYNFLTIDIGVDIQTPGEYSVMGYLCDENDRLIGWSIDHDKLSAGVCIMHLNFDGNSIRKHHVNGYYCLRDLTLFSGSSYSGLSINDYSSNPYNTSVYNYSDFYF